MVEIVRTAVVGLGTAAQSLHLPMLLRRHDRFETVAVVDISERRRTEAAAKWRIGEDASYASVADLMAAVRAKEIEVDAVVYAADGLRADDVLQIIKRGIPVLLQPPAGYGSADIQQILDFERLTGRSLVMMANTQLYDPSLDRFLEENRARDLRILEFETLMPAENAMYGHHHVTSAAYDIPAEIRTERRDALEAAVTAGAGEASTSTDRDLFVKGLLTGVAYQLGVLRWLFGPLTELHSVRQWPEGVIPGSIEVSGAVEDGAHVRIAWHYLPFAPQLRDSIRFVATRRQGRIDLGNPADADTRSTYWVTQRSEGRVTGTEILAESSALYAMHDAFFAFVTKGEAPRSVLADALADTEVARQLLGELAAADGRSLDPEPEPEPEPEEEVMAEPVSDPEVHVTAESEDDVTAEPVHEEPTAEEPAVAVAVADEPGEVSAEPAAALTAEPVTEPAPVSQPEPVPAPAEEPPVEQSSPEEDPALADQPRRAHAKGSAPAGIGIWQTEEIPVVDPDASDTAAAEAARADDDQAGGESRA